MSRRGKPRIASADAATRTQIRRRRLRLRLTGVAVLAATIAAAFTVFTFFTAEASSSAGWLLKCAYVNSAPDDPIVHAGMPGMSHLHDFYGNKSVTASATYKSMTQSSSKQVR